jgi:hypothetical protein
MGFFSMLGRLGLDTSDFQTGIKRAESATTGFANKLSGDIKGKLAAAFTIGAIAAWTKSVSDHYSKVADLADAYRITTEQVQKMQAAEMLNGQQIGSLVNVMTNLQEARKKAVAGDEKMIGVFNRMGLSLSDLKSESVGAYAVLEKVGSALSSKPDSSQAQADFLTLAGKDAAKLLKAVQDINQEPEITIIKDSQVRAISAAGDSLDIILTNMKAISALSFVKTTNALDDMAGIAGDLFVILSNPRSWTTGGENSIGILRKIVENRLALNRAIREGPSQSTPRQNGTRFGSDNPLFSMEGRDAGEMFGPEPGPGVSGKGAKSNGSRFDRPDTGNLARIGGLYFGADYNLRLMTLQQETKRLTERIAVSNEAIAQSVKE